MRKVTITINLFVFAESDGGRHDDVEYGPRPLEALGTQPISEDEDELQLSPLKIKQTEASKSIKIATISKVALFFAIYCPARSSSCLVNIYWILG